MAKTRRSKAAETTAAPATPPPPTTMKVRVLKKFAQAGCGEPYEKDEEIELPIDEAKQLITYGNVEPLDPVQAPAQPAVEGGSNA